MTSKAATVEEYLANLPPERTAPVSKLRDTIVANLPQGFKEVMGYGMLGYVVPHNLYPAGYHCTPTLPLPFINLASQKNNISLYHLGLYGSADLLNWFQEEYPKHSDQKPDMGKGCVRFKKPGNIPYSLIALLVSKLSVKQWIEMYEANIKNAGSGKK